MHYPTFYMVERVIMHIDMNAFFASVEQSANPFIRNRPVAVGSSDKYEHSALLAISYEAKARGVKKLSRAREALDICPELIVVPFDPLKYYSINKQIVSILKEYSPLVEVYSIDEAFIDLTDVLDLHKKSAVEIAREIKQRIIGEVGTNLTSSVGIAPNKLLAKIGSNWKKPDGLTLIEWDNRLEFLDKVPIGNIWGIGFHSTPKLLELGITSTKQLREMSDSSLRSIVGTYWNRLRMLSNGEHYDLVNPNSSNKEAKSMQHAHTMSIATNDSEYLNTVVRKMCERLARRLRKDNQMARTVYLGMRPENMKSYGWGSVPTFSDMEDLGTPTTNGKKLYDAACRVFSRFELGSTKIRLVVVGVGNLKSTDAMLFNIFTDPKVTSLDSTIDKVNLTYGEFTIRSADILHQKAKESELRIDKEDMLFHPGGG